MRLLLLIAIVLSCAACQTPRDICRATEADWQAELGGTNPRYDLDESGTVTATDFALWMRRCGG